MLTKFDLLKIRIRFHQISGHMGNINVWTWNVNSIKNKVELVNQLLLKHQIDILLLTETKITSKTEAILKFCDGYSCIWNSNLNSYHHGIALIYRSTLNIELLGNILPHEGDLGLPFSEKRNKDQISSTPLIDIENTINLAHSTEGRILTVKCCFQSETTFSEKVVSKNGV